MPADPVPSPAPTPPPQTFANDVAPPIDGVTPAPAASGAPITPSVPPPSDTPDVRQAKRRLLLLVGAAYAMYALWCFALVSMLPDPAGGGQTFVSVGLMSMLGGVLVLAGAGFFAFRRIAASGAPVVHRKRGLIKLVLLIVPGLLMSAAVPLMIMREPGIPLDIIDPTSAADFVAPLTVTFSAERAVAVLQRLGHRPQRYIWDTDGDGKANDQGLIPTTTAIYSKQGIYPVTVTIVIEGNDTRVASRRLEIPIAVFSLTPPVAVVEQPVAFSIANIFPDEKTMKDITWNFGDGTEPEVKKDPGAAHTYYAVGEYEVTALVNTQTNAVRTFRRVVRVQNPRALPFPVTLQTEPESLVGPAPFGALFVLRTQEPLKIVQWQFGDGKQEEGPALLRVGHSFDKPGVYPVVAGVRSASGQLAEITAIVRVAEPLQLPDLRFEGSPQVQGNKIAGDVPLKIRLTPRTSAPLVQFKWELPPDAQSSVTGETLDATFRKEGTYTITLVGQDAEGKVLRQPIAVQVTEPVIQPEIQLTPDGGVAPLAVLFDASDSFVPEDEEIAGYKWIFGDETQGAHAEELGAAQVRHTYMSPGEFRVTLQIVTSAGKEFTTDHTILVRKPSLSACIDSSRTEITAGKGIEFDSSCVTGVPTSYLWDVRDNADTSQPLAQSALPRYVYVFDTVGVYTVSLTVKDAWSNQSKKSVVVTVSAP